MTKRVHKNHDWLKALHCCRKSEKQQLLKAARPELINAICDCIKNVLNGNVPISQSEKKKLGVKKTILRKLVDRKTKTPQRKKLLVQHGGGILVPLLAPILTGLLGNLIS